MTLTWIFPVIFFSSIIGLFILAWTKTINHFNYQRLKREEKSKGEIIRPTKFLIKDFFVTFFMFPVTGKNKNEELEKLKNRLNKMVFAIYLCIILIIISVSIFKQF